MNNQKEEYYDQVNDLETTSSGSTQVKPTQEGSSNASFSEEGTREAPKIDPENSRFPYCIVWTPLPLISWLLPFIGHLGIATSEGIIHDFAGPYYISVDDFGFGIPYKYVLLDIEDPERYDKSVLKADKIYGKMNHNLFCNNCHSHVARALNKYEFKGKTDYTMVSVWWLTITRSRYVSWLSVVKTYLPFLIILSIILLIKFI